MGRSPPARSTVWWALTPQEIQERGVGTRGSVPGTVLVTRFGGVEAQEVAAADQDGVEVPGEVLSPLPVEGSAAGNQREQRGLPGGRSAWPSGAWHTSSRFG